MTDETEGQRDDHTEDSGSVVKDGDAAVQDGKVIVQINEMMVWSKMSRGPYNRNQVYGHVNFAPAKPWVIGLEVGDLDGADALEAAITRIQDAVNEVVQRKADELELTDGQSRNRSEASDRNNGVEVQTEVRSTEGKAYSRPSIQSVASSEPEDDGDDF